MELKISDVYDELAIEWQLQMILMLKDKLSKLDVDEDELKEVIGECVFDFSMFHDQGEIMVNGNPYNPRISFDDFEGNLISSDEETNLHEHAFENTNEAYSE